MIDWRGLFSEKEIEIVKKYRIKKEKFKMISLEKISKQEKLSRTRLYKLKKILDFEEEMTKCLNMKNLQKENRV